MTDPALAGVNGLNIHDGVPAACSRCGVGALPLSAGRLNMDVSV
jgi:hypothetical protein